MSLLQESLRLVELPSRHTSLACTLLVESVGAICHSPRSLVTLLVQSEGSNGGKCESEDVYKWAPSKDGEQSCVVVVYNTA